MLSVNGGTFAEATGFDIGSGVCTINNATINVFGTPDIAKAGGGPASWRMGMTVFNREIHGHNQMADIQTWRLMY